MFPVDMLISRHARLTSGGVAITFHYALPVLEMNNGPLNRLNGSRPS